MNAEYKYIRQARLPGVGERGQRALLAARRSLSSEGDLEREVEARYLRGAGVGLVEAARPGRAPVPGAPAALTALSPGAREVALGAFAALAQIQDILTDSG